MAPPPWSVKITQKTEPQIAAGQNAVNPAKFLATDKKAAQSTTNQGLAAVQPSQANQHSAPKSHCPEVTPGALSKSKTPQGPSSGVPSLEQLKSARTTKKWTEQALRATDAILPLQNGTNRWFSQRGMTGFGMPRDVNGKHVHRLVDEEYPQHTAENYAAEKFVQDKVDF